MCVALVCRVGVEVSALSTPTYSYTPQRTSSYYPTPGASQTPYHYPTYTPTPQRTPTYTPQRTAHGQYICCLYFSPTEHFETTLCQRAEYMCPPVSGFTPVGNYSTGACENCSIYY